MHGPFEVNKIAVTVNFVNRFCFLDVSTCICGMGHKIEAGCGIREILRAGYGMKISWRDRDALISIDGMRDSFKIVGGMQDLNSK